jgi:hypothetical protein
MKWNFLYQITAELPPEPLTMGLPPPDPRSLCPLSSTEFVEPPEQNSWVRHWHGTSALINFRLAPSSNVTGHEGLEGEYRYNSTLLWTSGAGGQRHAPAALPPGMTRHPLYRRLSGPQGRSGRMRKISPPQGFDPPTVQPVASRYTDWAIAAHIVKCIKISKFNSNTWYD